MSEYRLTPDQIGLQYETIRHWTTDGIQLTSWYLKSKTTAKGIVFFLHGNAENISTHIASVYWLPSSGYDVFMLDYRGFGRSSGHPSVPEVLIDIQSGFDWIQQHNNKNLPVFVLGQSIGAALAVPFSAQPAVNKHLSGVALDTAFTSYSEIARHALGQNWLTWLFQWPAGWLVQNDYDPIEHIDKISPVPVIFFHSEYDPIIPIQHSERLYAAAHEPKVLIRMNNTAHISTLNTQSMRQCLLDFFNRIAASCSATN